METPTYLAIGHLCHDLHQEKYILGGTAAYASLVAQKFNQQTAILTSVGPDFQFFDFLKRKEVAIHNQAAEQSTVFENIYSVETDDGDRIQFLRSRANTIQPGDMPIKWYFSPIVHVGLIANELNFELLDQFPNNLIGGSIQGCLRQWDETGKVSTCAMDWQLLQKLDIVFISMEDIVGVDQALDHILAFAKHVVVTDGKNGVTIYKDHQSFFFTSYPTTAVDPTGAGDVFATAYLINYYQTQSIESAAIFAHCAASIVVESPGLTGLDSMEKVDSRVAAYYSKFS